VPRPSPAVASPARLRAHLLAAEAAVPLESRIARDPLRFPRRYAGAEDAEVAAVVAALLAFGRVDLFGPVIARVLEIADLRGGPARFAREFEDDGALAGIGYRWNRADDFVLLFRTLRRVYADVPSIGALFSPGPARASLGGAIDRLRGFVPGEPSRGFRTWIPHPDEGSACKRWLMLMRWMVRREGGDLGLWTHLSPRDLVIPLDTHVMRLSRLLGLTQRNDAGWRTAEEVTEALRRLDAEDPVRFDFALAHLGISGACLGRRDADVCPGCPLDPVCRAPS
jgi:uncharacterized protein (TIGR02757 family)